MSYRKLTPTQVQAELEAGTALYVADEYGYAKIESSAIITRVHFFGFEFLGVGANKARIFVREDEISAETWYTLDTSSRIKVYRKTDFDTD